MEIYNELVRAIIDEVQKQIKGEFTSSNGVEVGQITNNGLKLDNFKYEIKDYSTIETINPTNVGDRVLVSTCGNEVIVVGRIV